MNLYSFVRQVGVRAKDLTPVMFRIGVRAKDLTPVGLLLLSLVAMPAFAQSAEQRLNDALANLDNLTAEFKNSVRDDDKKIVQQSSGTLAIQRPGKFSWIYTEPYEQQIIADGEELWIYDVDLDQVTVRPGWSQSASP
ncbi:MAG: outer membrane lipoprotein chaperone LolA [Gammaproteobacteria bacterium]|nr:outer membrane lipoprotein chaperone LolA [Gammaproteobacteria bacterium]